MTTTITTNPADVLRAGYGAFSIGEMPVLEALFAPDAVWHEPGNSPISGSYVGWPAVAGLFVSYAERSHGTFVAELSDVLANDTQAISIAHVRAQHDGRTIDQDNHLLIRVIDGRVAEARVIYTDQAAFDAFWA